MSARCLIVRRALPGAVVAAAAALAACSNPEVARRADKAEHQVTQAATTPLADFNLVRDAIPAPLLAAQAAPYALPAARDCAALAGEVQALNGALGADLDTPPTATDPGLIERGADAVSDAAAGALRGAAEGLIPYRGWVRKLTGAERYSKEVAAAIAAGTVRRAYLKGLGQAAGCGVPAAPAAASAPASAASAAKS